MICIWWGKNSCCSQKLGDWRGCQKEVVHRVSISIQTTNVSDVSNRLMPVRWVHADKREWLTMWFVREAAACYWSSSSLQIMSFQPSSYLQLPCLRPFWQRCDFRLLISCKLYSTYQPLFRSCSRLCSLSFTTTLRVYQVMFNLNVSRPLDTI